MKPGLYLQIVTLFISLLVRAQSGAGNWMYAGPHQTNGQVKGMIKALWVDKDHPSFILAGSSSGGLFKCENAEAELLRWKNISDTYDGINFGITGIVVVPGTNNRTIFVSTGHNSGIPLGYGNGILKTDDGGLSWQEVGPKPKRRNLFMIEGLVMNPQNPAEMIAYTQKEIFVTRNQWRDYQRIVLPVDSTNPNISLCDIEFAPYEPGKFYACTRTYNFSDARIYCFNGYGKEVKDIGPKIECERFEVECINDERWKGRFYAAYGNSNAYVAYFDSKSFTTLNALPVSHFYASAYWNLEFTVDPQDTATMYLAMTEVSRSSDGGKSFTKIASYNGDNTHADIRAVFFLRNADGRKFYTGNDGGVSLLVNESAGKWKNLNGSGLDANQFWGADIAQSDTVFIAGGAQDNGSFLIKKGVVQNTMAGCGDGYLGLVIDEQSAITQCNPPSFFYHDFKNHTNSYLSVNDNRFETKRPLVQTDSFVYVGYGDLWKIKKSDLKKGITSFTRVSEMPAILYDSKSRKNNSIRAMSIHPLGTAVLGYANPNWGDKENNGKLFFCDNIHSSNPVWIDLTARVGYNSLEVCRWFELANLQIDPFDPFKFYMVLKNPFDQTNTLLTEVNYLPDSGKCAVRGINSNMNAIGINKIVIDKFNGIKYLACDDGVYYQYPSGDSLWHTLNTGVKLPRVMVTDIAFNYATNTLLAATYGRGLWQTSLLAFAQTKVVNENTVINSPYKVDGKLIVGKKKQLMLNSKLIITKDSKIELRKGSTLIVKKDLVRDENNKLIDLDVLTRKNKGARIIYR